MLPNEDVFLRRVQISDAKTLLRWENDPNVWSVSERTERLELEDIRSFILNQQEASEFEMDQIRYIILSEKQQTLLGTLDLYEIDWNANSAFVGILIADENERGKGFGQSSLKKLFDLATSTLELDLVKTRIQPNNKASISLFEKTGFQKKTEIPERILKDGTYIEFFTFEKWLRN